MSRHFEGELTGGSEWLKGVLHMCPVRPGKLFCFCASTHRLLTIMAGVLFVEKLIQVFLCYA